MAKSVTAIFFACFFFIGSITLPLGDFSLMTDLPGMYHTYEKLTTPDEVGVLDFVGDYLLGGKSLLNHNHADKPESRSLSVQFQHQASNFSFFEQHFYIPRLSINHFKIDHVASAISVETTDFHAELFRPPLA